MRRWPLRIGGLSAAVAVVLACAGAGGPGASGNGAPATNLPDLPTPGCTYAAGSLPDGRLYVLTREGVVTLDGQSWTNANDLERAERFVGYAPSDAVWFSGNDTLFEVTAAGITPHSPGVHQSGIWTGEVPVQVHADDTNPTEVLVLEGSAWTPLPPPPLGEVTWATSLPDGVIVLTGGRHAMTRPDAGPSLLARSNTSRDAWSTIPLPDGIHSDFAFGGRRGEGFVLVGHTVTAVWDGMSEEARILPHPAGFEPMAGHRGRLRSTTPVEGAAWRVITGNQDVPHHWVLDDDTGWRDAGALADGRRCGVVFEADGAVYVAGGFIEGEGKLATVVRLP